MSGRIPVTLLTGDLGAGKTTLLNRILAEDHGRRYAVIVNEFGQIGIDQDLVVGAADGVVEMSNGCICCTVKDDLTRILTALLARGGFDAVLIETTGLAAPAPVIATFLTDRDVSARAYLDSVITLVDARNAPHRLDTCVEAREQIAVADQLILNKMDLVTAEELVALKAGLRRLNPLAPIHPAVRAAAPLDRILARGGFDLGRLADFAHDEPLDNGHDEPCDAGHARGHHHRDQDITSVSMELDLPLDGMKVTGWLDGLLAARGGDILRAKGILSVKGEDRRVVFQAVHALLDGALDRPWTPDETRRSRMVFIGRNLDGAELRAGLEATAGPCQLKCTAP
jgi:G3E family GTPase